MAKPSWGLKRKCLKCGTFFYDMHKEVFSCPKCHAEYTKESYEEIKNKQLQKLAKKVAPRIDDETIDEETLLQMTEDVPLSDDDDEQENDGLNILDEESDLINDKDENITDLVDHYDDDENINDK